MFIVYKPKGNEENSPIYCIQGSESDGNILPLVAPNETHDFRAFRELTFLKKWIFYHIIFSMGFMSILWITIFLASSYEPSDEDFVRIMIASQHAISGKPPN